MSARHPGWRARICLAAGFLAPAFALAGPPSVVDPFKGLPEAAGFQASATKIRDLQGQRVAVLYTENTRAHFQWSESRRGKSLSDPDTKMALEPYRRLTNEIYATQPLVAALLEPLRRKTAAVTPVASYAEYLAGPYDVLALLDVQFSDARYDSFLPVVGEVRRAGMSTQLFLVMRDGRMTTVAAKVERRPEVDGALFVQKVAQIRREATTKFVRALDDLLVGPELPPPPPALPAPDRPKMLSLADQLKLIEEERAAGRISEEEAQIRRNRILRAR